MALKRTMVHADPEDLAVIKEAAALHGIPEAEILREGSHLAALRVRQWSEPLEIPAFALPEDAARRAEEDLDDWGGSVDAGTEPDAA